MSIEEDLHESAHEARTCGCFNRGRMGDHLIEAIAAAWASFGSVETRIFYQRRRDDDPHYSGPMERRYETTFHIEKTSVGSLQVPGEFSCQSVTFGESVLGAIASARDQFCSGPGTLMTEWIHALDEVERVTRNAIEERGSVTTVWRPAGDHRAGPELPGRKDQRDDRW